MSIGSRELRELSSAIAGTVPKGREATVTRGVVTSTGDVTWVLLDGADAPTPVQATTCAVSPGDQVSVRIQDGSATVTGNVTQPAQTAATVAEAVEPVMKVAESNKATITRTKTDLASTNTKVSQVSQDLSGFKTIVSDTYETKAGAAQTKSTLETSIKQTNDAIALKANKTDLDAATKRLTTAETSIKANADQISLRATKTEVPGLVNVGGRNLLPNSDTFPDALPFPFVTGIEVIGGANFAVIDPSQAKTWAQVNMYITKNDVDGSKLRSLSGIPLTLSFDYVADTSPGTNFGRAMRHYGPDGTMYASPWPSYKIIGDGKVHHEVVTATFDITHEPKLGGVIYIYPFTCKAQVPGTYKIGNVKLEIGNVPTAWTPAPEDVEADISTAKQAAIDVSADAIKGFVESAGGKTTYKQTDQGFTWTIESPMTQVADGTARTNASNAEAAASSAATDASNAASAASKAQTTANRASDTANTAKTTAESANKAAGEAKKAADDAAKTATAFMDYGETEAGKLTIGHRSGGELSGARAKLGADRLSFESEDGTELASFGANDVYLGNKSDAAIHLRNDGLISANSVSDYEGSEFTAMSVAAPSVEVSGSSVASLSASEEARTVNGQRLAGYSASVTASGHGELYDPDGDQGRQANPHAWVELATQSVPAGTNGGEDGGCGSEVALVSTGDRSHVAIESYVTEADGSRSGGSSVEVATGDVRVITGELRAEVSGTVGVTAGDLVSISHSTSDRGPLGVGFGAGGNNRGVSADISGSGNDGFAWLFAVNDSQHWPIIPGLYHGDTANCSLIPVYTSQKNLGSIKAGSSTTGTMSISKSGYSPIGIIGTNTSASTYPGHVLVNAWVTDRGNGTGTLHYAVKNTTDSSANTIKITWHVLWARQTDINGTYVS